MRKVDKSELGREIKKNVRNIMPDYATQYPPDSIPVIDGGWLLHFIRWKKNATYADVLGQYSSFLRTKYGMCCVLICLMGTNMTQPKITNTSVTSDWKGVSINCDSRKMHKSTVNNKHSFQMSTRRTRPISLVF